MTKVGKPTASSRTPAAKPAARKPVARTVAAAVAAPEPVLPPITPKITEAVTETAPIQQAEETTVDTMNTASAKAQTLFNDMGARAQSAMEKGTKAFEEANEFSKGNVEAVVESAKIAAKGFEAMGQDAAEYGRKSFENATAAMKSLSSVKSPTDFFKLQSDFMRGAFDAMVAESSRSTEAMLKLAGEVAQPISSRAALAVEKVKLAA